DVDAVGGNLVLQAPQIGVEALDLLLPGVHGAKSLSAIRAGFRRRAASSIGGKLHGEFGEINRWWSSGGPVIHRFVDSIP
ncbi:MAG TPA: hypothetical protein VG457_12030, partial [Planctomycetota bacterium]|nr:hypothetical protein [Planctomycetota bacterium]